MILKLFKLIREEHTVGQPPVKKGQRVVLLHDSPYMPGDANPKQGSSYHCEGVVTRAEVGVNIRLRVRWDNGNRNDYIAAELMVVPLVPDSNWKVSFDSNNPNITFKETKKSREMMRQIREQQRAFEESRTRAQAERVYYATTTGNTTWG